MENRHTKEDLAIMQRWSLQRKIQVTQTRIMEWYLHYEGKVYISFSGGKDSTVLLDLARRAYPEIPAVFADTGLEYPEIREFVKSKDNVTWVYPEVINPKTKTYQRITFADVIKQYGYPIVSKEVAKSLYYAKKGSNWAIKRFDGKDKVGKESKFKERFKKYKYLMKAPFYASSYCCDVMKKYPMHRYEKATRNKPIIGTMAGESQQREAGWLKTGCNSFSGEKSQPMSFWTEQDILQYLKLTGIPYCSVYGDIVSDTDGQLSMFEDADTSQLHTTGVSRTGCMFCMFGCHLEENPNRFQKMQETHPKQYQYCIGGGAFDDAGIWKPTKEGLGQGFVMDYYGVNYRQVAAAFRPTS